MQDVGTRRRAADLEALLAGVESLPDAAARERAGAAVTGLIELYGEALSRVLRHAAASGPQMVEALYGDELVSQLLLVHDLHPLSVTVDRALEPVGSLRTPLPLVQIAGPGPSPAGAGPAPTHAGREPVEPERCELCAELLAAEHRHVVDTAQRSLLCACRACALLFDRPAAGGDHYHLVPDRCDFLPGFALDDAAWAGLGIPVAMAFFLRSGASGRVTAFYPSPAGSTESTLALDSWSEIEAANPVLADLQPDVEALLVNRVGDAREHWIVGVDVCYRLVGLVRSTWEGFAGGDACWEAVGSFFSDLHARSGSRIASPNPYADRS